MTGKEELTRGEALARVAVLEAELAELRGRVSVPSDRDALLYLMERFDSEESNCPVCGHSEATSDMDSAYYLREYLAAAPAPVERVEQDALRKRFDQIEREVCEGKHTAASVFTQMRTAAFYTTPQPAPTAAQDVAGLVGKMRMLIAAGSRLNAEAEECIYDDATAEVAAVEYWSEFRDALEAATAALAAHQSGGAK